MMDAWDDLEPQMDKPQSLDADGEARPEGRQARKESLQSLSYVQQHFKNMIKYIFFYT